MVIDDDNVFVFYYYTTAYLLLLRRRRLTLHYFINLHTPESSHAYIYMCMCYILYIHNKKTLLTHKAHLMVEPKFTS